ncbi:nicotinate-nucleotide--dimethylbenzimidazole phosphoribosyltransferase [Streptomyces sp. NPDC057682]|uniref:nicotinate-nucleotide--dimethylbenzimidazole phosphoribosyltransferase n=1 Tax=Streptomyces sp. NPDC057682 TaxID=3346210 RepID=UPI0036BE7350
MSDTGRIPGEGLPENAGMVEQPGIPAPDGYSFPDHSEHTPEEDDLLLMPSAQGAWGEPHIVPAPHHDPLTDPLPGPAQPQGPVQFQEQTPVYAGHQQYAEPLAQTGQGTHESGGRDSGHVDLGGVRMPQAAPAPAPSPASPAPSPVRRPLHRGPASAESPSYGGTSGIGVVRSLADRGPAGAPQPRAQTAVQPPAARHAGPATAEPEYFELSADEAAVLPGPQLGEIPPQGSGPWAAPAAAPVAEQAPAAETVVPAAPEAAQETAPETVPEAVPETVPATVPEAVPAQVPDAAVAPEAVADARAAKPAPAGSAAAPAAGVPVPETAAVPAGTPVVEAPAAEVPVAEVPAEAAPVALDPIAQAPIAQAPAEDAPVDEAARPEAAVGEAPVVEAPPAEAVAAEAPAVEAAAPETLPDEPRSEAVVVDEAPATLPDAVLPDGSVPVPGDGQLTDGPPSAAPATAEQPVAEQPAAAAPPAEPEAPAEIAAQPEPEAADAGTAPVTEKRIGPIALGPVPEPEAESGPEVIETPDLTRHQPEATLPEAVAAEAAVPAEAPVAAEPQQSDGVTPEVREAPEAPAENPVQEAEAVVRGAEAPAQAEAAGETRPDAPAHDGTTPPADAGAQEPHGPRGSEPAETVAAPDDAPADTTDEAADPVPPAPGYDDAEREAVLRVMRERRDIRNGFRGDPVPHEVLLRVLEAAHTAPSVGHSQPWDFVVIRSAETRRSMHELAQRQRDAYAKSLPKARAKQFKELKIEAILDTPVNIVVTADPTRGGRHTLGRHTQPQMAPYSSALAVENLWLAARAEGLGVGWVSFFDEREMVRALGLPEHLEVVAYLCVGYVDEFPEEPELMQAGWSKRRPLSWVVHEETYGRRALPGEEPHDLLQETVSSIRPLDAKALGEAWERQKRMTKPAGALGMLEIISAQLSGLSRMCPPPIPEPAAVAIFAGDHGVHAQGVTAWPQEVTGQMVANFLGGGAVCNAFAAQVGAEVCVVDVGVATELPATPGLLPRKVRAGTADFTTGPALTREEVLAAIEVGIETARDLVAAGNKGLLTGEMGIANTTASAALICVYTGMDPAEVTGRGTGINDEMHARKVDVVRRALELHQPDPADPIGVLAAVGGLEHAAMAGFLLGGASLRTPVVLDGVSAGAAALVARAIAPEALAACIAGHRSAEPGHVAALNKLGLRPLVDLDLRLGEGTGALLALPIVQSAARAMHEVATFDSAGVTEK